MSINERIAFLKKFYKKKGIEFHKYINIPSSTVKNVVGIRKTAPSHLLLEAILKAFPEVNSYWLIMGKGSTFLTELELEQSWLMKGILTEIDEDPRLTEEYREKRKNFSENIRLAKEKKEFLNDLAKFISDYNLDKSPISEKEYLQQARNFSTEIIEEKEKLKEEIKKEILEELKIKNKK